jgi:hypothetical protein
MTTPEKFYRDIDLQWNQVLNALDVCYHRGYLSSPNAYLYYPQAKRGEIYTIAEDSKKLGGEYGVYVSRGDTIVCHSDSLAVDASAAPNWTLLRHNVAPIPLKKTITAQTSGSFYVGFVFEFMQISAYETNPWREVGIYTEYDAGVVTWASAVPFTGIIVCTPFHLNTI